MLTLVKGLLRSQIMLQSSVVPRRDRRYGLLRLSEIILDVVCGQIRVLKVLLDVLGAGRLTRFFEFSMRSTQLRLLVADDATGVRKSAANTSNVLFILVAFVRSQVLKTIERSGFILVFFACVSVHLRLSSAALHLCVNLLRPDKIIHRLHQRHTWLNSIQSHRMYLLSVRKVHPDLVEVAFHRRLHEHAVWLHYNLVDAALD